MSACSHKQTINGLQELPILMHRDVGGGGRLQHDNGTYEFQFLNRDMLPNRVQCRARTPATLILRWSAPPENDLQRHFTAVIGV